MADTQIPSRRNDSSTLSNILSMVDALQRTVSAHVERESTDRERQLQHNERVEYAVSALQKHLDEVISAGFVDGDLSGHKTFHSTAIETMQARKDFWSKLSYELAKYGLGGLLIWLGYVAWRAFLLGPK